MFWGMFITSSIKRDALPFVAYRDVGGVEAGLGAGHR